MDETPKSPVGDTEDNSETELINSFNKLKARYIRKFLPYLPFLPAYIISKWPNHVPELWKQSYKLFSASFWDFVLLLMYWVAYKLLFKTADPFIILFWKAGVIAFLGVLVYRHAKELLAFLLFPTATSNESDALTNLESSIKEYAIKKIPPLLGEAKIQKADTVPFLLGLFVAALSIGKTVLREMFVRIDVVLLSVRFLLFSGVIVVFYALFYNYVFYLYEETAFNIMHGVSFPDFVIYSFGVFTTADFGGITPNSFLVRVLACSELASAIIAVSIILPLIVFSYERALEYYGVEIGKNTGKPSKTDTEFVKKFVNAARVNKK